MAKKVLLAESVLFFRQLIRRTLSRFPDLVLKDADDFGELEAALGEGGWDLVLLDLELQGGSEAGDLVEFVRSKAPGSPLMVLSAHGDKVCGGTECGVVGFFPVPIDLERLSEEVGKVLGLG